MVKNSAKSINLLLNDGDLNGVILIEDSSWNSGQLYSAPRLSVSELLKTGACDKFGVYLLFSDDTVYIGQSSDLSKRLQQHLNGKDWWQSVVVLTKSNDKFTHSDIDYLESVLIKRANDIGCLDCDNKNKGNKPKVDMFKKIELDQYLDEALFLMSLIGIKVFNTSKVKNSTHINIYDPKTTLQFGNGGRKIAKEYLETNGIKIGKNMNYSAKNKDGDYFWINPRPEQLSDEWWIILNNTNSRELIVLKVPATTFSTNGNKNNTLSVRENGKVDIRINISTFIDKHTGIDFSKYIINKVKF